MTTLEPEQTVAILDIGSNSVRLVIFRLFGRLFQQVHNEKVACGLGEGVARDGALSATSVLATRKALARFRLICDAVGVDDMRVLATAALREAANGASFLDEITDLVGVEPSLLEGVDEARLASAGAIAGSYGFEGLVGDLGGGSLELAHVSGLESEGFESFKLGALRLKVDAEGSADKALKICRKTLQNCNLNVPGAESGNRKLAAIGGTWRALAKAHQQRVEHPLSLVHQYVVSAKDLADLCRDVMKAHAQDNELEYIKKLSKNRRDLLPFGAASMLAVLDRFEISEVEFSAYGLREGCLFDGLSAQQKAEDPLLLAAQHVANREARAPRYGHELFEWTGALLHHAGQLETDAQKRLRHAACLMSDLSWWGHPDYRARQSVDLSVYNNLVGLHHPARGYIAIALAMRQAGPKRLQKLGDFDVLAGEHLARSARILGGAFRLAHALSGSHHQLLEHTQWRAASDGVELQLAPEVTGLMCDSVISRANQLAEWLDQKVVVTAS